LTIGLGKADRLDHYISPIAAGQLPYRLDRVLLARIDHVGGPESSCPLELPFVDVDRDHHASSCERSACYCSVTDAAATDYRNRVATAHPTCVHGRAESCHHSTPDEARSFRACPWVDLHRLSGGHERLLGQRADPERRTQLRPVLQRHLLRGVGAVEAIPRSSS